MNDEKRAIGYRSHLSDKARRAEYARLARHANLQLTALGLPSTFEEDDPELAEIAGSLVRNYRHQLDRLADERCPADRRIEDFLARYFAEVDLSEPLRLPDRTLILDLHGMARVLSLPVDGDRYKNEWLQSYRVRNGVLHNPTSDRRTTQGTFHVAMNGLPIPGDKKAVRRETFARLFEEAMRPAPEALRLPFTSTRDPQAKTIASLYLRPLVRPAVPGVEPERSMEIRFFAPGALISNLDFVESIFGNAGDPWLPENDAALDVEGWTGHTGCVILAPQLSRLTKKEVGLPHVSDESLTERERRDGMCWEKETELYNDGRAFKISCRDESGVVVTLISDNYFGYCKKEVKTQISFAANLMGDAEEEHAGGAVAFASYSLGDQFQAKSRDFNRRSFEDVTRDYASFIEVHPDGYGTDRKFPDLIYIPETAFATLRGQSIRWEYDGKERSIPLQPGKVYMTPSGYKLRMEKHPAAPSWRLIGTVGEGVFCHKPCTVSGGGKSEISKSIFDYMHYGPIFVTDAEKSLADVQRLIEETDFEYSKRWKPGAAGSPDYRIHTSRGLLDERRSLGSVIKLLTPSSEYTDEYNAFLRSIPDETKALVYVIKRFQEPGWEKRWRESFGVDIINGQPGHEFKFRDRKLIGSYLRVGYLNPSTWRTFKLRQDFAAAFKIQTEDDITASTVVRRTDLDDVGDGVTAECVKLAQNCEYRLFQRPDEAIHRGFDTQAELDLAGGDNFISNFEPLTKSDVKEMLQLVTDFDAFSEPMQRLLRETAEDDDAAYVVCSANPRKIDGQPSKNPRYLQNRPDLVRPFDSYVAEIGMRLHRALPADAPVIAPVGAVLLGRRNNPPEPDKGIRELAVYNPIHYQELPELFMDFVASLTGKSPSTTGFGSEGAMTKSPFNCLRTSADLNTALVSYLLTGLAGFSTPAGHIGPNVRVDHDLSLLIPEVWCRLRAAERDPEYLKEKGFLEPLQDETRKNGEIVPVSRLGYRITERFVKRFFGRIFDNPDKVFDEAMLCPESQDREAFLDGVAYIAESQRTVAQGYLDDGTIDELCPPLAALVRIMAEGSCDGMTIESPEFRAMFTRDAMLESDWYRARLETYRDRRLTRCDLLRSQLETTRSRYEAHDVLPPVDLDSRFAAIERQRQELLAPDFVAKSYGTLGADPMSRGTDLRDGSESAVSAIAGG